MSRKQTDALGQEILVGDILLSASKTGNIKIGRVEKIFPSGHITLKVAEKRNIFAYEEGAPKVMGKVYKALKNEDGTPKLVERQSYYGGVQKVQAYGYVDELVRDTTIVRKDWTWKFEEAAHYARFVVKSTADHPLFNLNQFLALGYDDEKPDLEV